MGGPKLKVVRNRRLCVRGLKTGRQQPKHCLKGDNPTVVFLCFLEPKQLDYFKIDLSAYSVSHIHNV